MDNNQKVISHYGVPGMRWGHRKAARSFGKALGKAKSAKEESDRIASNFEKNAKDAQRQSNILEKQGKMVRARALAQYAVDNKNKAAATRNEGERLARKYKNIATLKKQKLKDLEAKYGSQNKKQVNDLIKKYSNKKYDLMFDDTDVVVDRMQQFSEMWNSN